MLARQEAPRAHPLRDGKPRSKCLLPGSHRSLQRCQKPIGSQTLHPRLVRPLELHGHSLLTALPSPVATLVPSGSRQRMASGLREGLLQRGPASSQASATLPTSTTPAGQKHPVEVSPVPSNDDMVLGETPGTGSSWEGVSDPHQESVGWWHHATRLSRCPSVCPPPLQG